MTNLETAAFEAMTTCEARGDYSTMRTHLNATADLVIDRSDHETLKKFAHLLLRVIRANDYEAMHGAGALMDWDHPFNQEMLASSVFTKPIQIAFGKGPPGVAEDPPHDRMQLQARPRVQAPRQV